MFVEHYNKNNNIDVLFTVCVGDLNEVKILTKFQSKIQIPNICKLNSNFKTYFAHLHSSFMCICSWHSQANCTVLTEMCKYETCC